jgi:Zn-dependent peptidase ImmA (M78 family)
MAKARIERHPDFPFREGRDAALLAEQGRFLDAPEAGSDDHTLLHEFIVLSHAYAFLERLIQGDIRYELPVHAGVAEEGIGLAPEEEAERLAAGERELLDRLEGASGDLPEILDEMGIKVLTSEEDSGSSEDLLGAFYYVGEVGPAILGGTPLDVPETAFVLAHEFAHLIADVDPYRPRFCRWDRRTLANRTQSPAEARADRFARALLMPESRLKRLLGSLDVPAREDAVDPRWEQLATLFEVAPALVRNRLVDLGIPLLGPMAAAHERRGSRENGGTSSPAEPSVPREERLALPERFVNLALAAYSERVLDPADLARFLRTTEADVNRILAWARIPRRRPAEDLEIEGLE